MPALSPLEPQIWVTKESRGFSRLLGKAEERREEEFVNSRVF
jgi:hypothetical protein